MRCANPVVAAVSRVVADQELCWPAGKVATTVGGGEAPAPPLLQLAGALTCREAAETGSWCQNGAARTAAVQPVPSSDRLPIHGETEETHVSGMATCDAALRDPSRCCDYRRPAPRSCATAAPLQLRATPPRATAATPED